jgi:hypothetical protein
MSRVAQEVRAAGGRLAAAPTAVFVAVLTAGMALSSTARHLGVCPGNAVAARKGNVVLACPRASAARSAAARAHAPSSKTANTSPATAAHVSAGSSVPGAAPQGGAGTPSEKNSAGKSGGGGVLTVPLPDFNAPELSRFISPL